MIRCFDADWARKPFKPDPKSRLLWCPNNGRERIATVIDEAKKSVAIAVTIQPREKTLTDQEIDAVAAKIVAEVTKKTGGTLRA